MMTASEKNEISLLYSKTCKTYDKVIEPEILKLIVEDLSDLDFHKVAQALHQYRLDEKNMYWPRMSKIRSIVNPTQSTESLSNETASRIREAISKFGWSNPQAAKEFIGALGWDLVQRFGGWQYICENHGVALNPLTFQAQARDLSKSMIESAQLGKYNQPIGIPESKQKEQLTSVTKLLTAKEFPK